MIQPPFEGPVHPADHVLRHRHASFFGGVWIFHVKSSFTSFVTVFVTVRLLPFFLTVVLICSFTLMVSTFRARWYTDHRYWSMHSSLRTHSSEASSGLTFTSGSASGTFMTGSATEALVLGSASAVLNSVPTSATSERASAAIVAMRARAALTCRSEFAGAQSRTAKLAHTKQPKPLNSLMFAPISLCPLPKGKARACDCSATSQSARGARHE